MKSAENRLLSMILSYEMMRPELRYTPDILKQVKSMGIVPLISPVLFTVKMQ